jgi:hypothetical protein
MAPICSPRSHAIFVSTITGARIRHSAIGHRRISIRAQTQKQKVAFLMGDAVPPLGFIAVVFQSGRFSLYSIRLLPYI